MNIIQALHVLKNSFAVHGGELLSIQLNPQAYAALKKELSREAIFKVTAFENPIPGKCQVMGVDVFVKAEEEKE